ncbi:hypothetical protein IE077_004247 [Cardiosporidium cionae]|uniref:Uncharacterized protein n=1 Tax=Cardiosporidium cionae TaxID=476202 RepID=A0ABQ7J6C2_9APIC|nr:hypothetical protein IE077_004247 [Cardiosporidium cionae]|eukprot:KAF8819235.1 hypothetical protein IE077_004247 [Cardiosporidium cionae]
MSLWDSGFNQPGRLRRTRQRFSLFYLAFIFSAPTLLMYFGCSPTLLGWWVNNIKPIQYPPQADPRIIRRIYHGKEPPAERKEGDSSINL